MFIAFLSVHLLYHNFQAQIRILYELNRILQAMQICHPDENASLPVDISTFIALCDSFYL